MIKNKEKGFTLIELLVVIAIIGILSSVVLASLNTARNKGKAASAQASLSQARAQAEIGVDSTTGAYVLNICTATGPGGLATLIAAATNQGATNVTCGQNTATGVQPTAWAISATLPDSATSYYCVDSAGFSGKSTVAPATEVASGFSSTDVVCDNA
jgi:prepilin-type N-terminal cleavage/methylation domain-containing protein